MLYILYKTTNLLTGQYYIGKHKQPSIEFDGYYGSSPSLNKDIEKFGADNFVRETLQIFADETMCYIAENTAIGELWRADTLCYNKQPGGKGFSSGDNHYSNVSGFSAEHIENLKKSRKQRPPATQETRKKMSESRLGTKRNSATKEKMSKAQSGENNPMSGKNHSEENRRKIGRSLAGKYTGVRNSQFKGYYVTPYGKFTTVNELGNNIKNISKGTVFVWCKNCETIITKNMVGVSKFLTKDMVGKTFRDIGFYMEYSE